MCPCLQQSEVIGLFVMERYVVELDSEEEIPYSFVLGKISVQFLAHNNSLILAYFQYFFSQFMSKLKDGHKAYMCNISLRWQSTLGVHCHVRYVSKNIQQYIFLFRMFKCFEFATNQQVFTL